MFLTEGAGKLILMFLENLNGWIFNTETDPPLDTPTHPQVHAPFSLHHPLIPQTYS